MRLFILAVVISLGCASSPQQEASALIHESDTSTPVMNPVVANPVATIAPTVVPTATPAPTMLEVKKTKRVKAKK